MIMEINTLLYLGFGEEVGPHMLALSTSTVTLQRGTLLPAPLDGCLELAVTEIWACSDWNDLSP